MFRFYSSYALLFSGLTHLLCCGVPILLGTISVLTNVVFFESVVTNLSILESLEGYLFALTTLMFLSLISFEIYNKKIKCSELEDCCNEDECDDTKRRIKTNILIASFLYVLNSSIFLSETIL